MIVTPVARIIKTSKESEYKQDTLVLIDDLYIEYSENNDWVDFHALKLEKPGIADRIKEPDMMISNLNKLARFKCRRNKLTPHEEEFDQYTFLLPEALICGYYED